MIVLFSKFSCLLQGMGRYFIECVAIVNHKHVIYCFFNYRKMKYMIEKHDAWHGAMVWPHRALVKIWEGLAYVIMHALHKLNHHRESFMVSRGKSPRFKGPGIQIFFLACHSVVSTINIPSQMQVFKLGIFPGSFTILGDYVHFLVINPHNSNSNNWCMKRCTRTVLKNHTRGI